MHRSQPVCSLVEMRHAETDSYDQGVSELVLMERAAEQIAAYVTRHVPIGSKICILAGTGNNGGDGLAVARLLQNDFTIHVYVIQGRKTSHGFETQLQKLNGSKIVQLQSLAQALLHIADSHLVLEAILGIGQHGELDGEIAAVAQSLRTVSEKVWSFDVPLGVCGDTGNVVDGAIVAARTLSIQWAKRGLFQYPALEHAGLVEVLDIGLTGAPYFSLVGESDIVFKHRRPDVHKGSLGRVLVIGGSAGMEGAAYLSAVAALKAGAGLVAKVSLDPDARFIPLPEAISYTLQGKNISSRFESLIAIAEKFDVLVIGPGASLDDDVFEFFGLLFDWLMSEKKPCVLDADALNAIARYKEQEQHFRFFDAILTPHPGEAARLLGCDSTDIQRDRFKAAACLQGEFGGVAILKGAGTLLQSEEAGYINQTGSPYLACPGSGDVLAGILGTFYAHNLAIGVKSPALKASMNGVWFHGLAGELASERSGGIILASEIAYALPAVIK